MTNESLETLKLGASLGAGSSGEVFEVVGRESSHVIKRFNSLARDRQCLERNFARMAAMPDLHGTPAVLDHRFS
ncbi:MAG: hypothetical protein ABL994_07435, partial [Verrucomicrobiales bacterium]